MYGCVPCGKLTGSNLGTIRLITKTIKNIFTAAMSVA